MRRKVLQCRIISKDRRFRDKVVLIPRIRLSPNAETLPAPVRFDSRKGILLGGLGLNSELCLLLYLPLLGFKRFIKRERERYMS